MAAKLRLGVVGTGYLGQIHARIYAGMPTVDLVGVVDIDPATAAHVAESCGCSAFARPEDLVGKVDAVSIVVPTVDHLAVARPFLASGVHMLMEKPLAPTHAEALELVQLAERAGVVFQVGHLERFNAGLMALASSVDDPRFIEAHRLSTFVERATDVDVVIDLMIHDIDIVMSLVKSDIKSIEAAGARVLTDHVDIANARIAFQNGAVANVTASRVSNKKQRRIRVFSKQGYHALNFMDQQIEVVCAQPSPDGGRAQIVTENVKIEPKQPLNAELDHFVETIKQRGTPLVTGRMGLKALETALLVKEKIAACMV
jgi:predicted dehydrogenase